MKKTALREQIQQNRKLLPKIFKKLLKAFNENKYPLALKEWQALQQAHLDSREFNQIDSYIKSFCTHLHNQEKQIGLNTQLHEFINQYYAALLEFLRSINETELKLTETKYLLVNSQPSQYEALERYCDYLVRAATRYHHHQEYSLAIKSLLCANIQLDQVIELHFLINDIPNTVITAEVDIFRMRQAIYYALCHHCILQQHLENYRDIFANKAVEKFNLCNNHHVENNTYINMKSLMQGTVWLICTSRLVDNNKQLGEYYQLKAKGMRAIWDNLLNGTVNTEFLNFNDIKSAAEYYINALQELIFKNHLSGMLTNSLKQSLLEFQQIVFCINLDNYEMDDLTAAFSKLEDEARQQTSEINPTTLVLYHHRCATLAMLNFNHNETQLALAKAEECIKTLGNNHYIQLRFWTTAGIAKILDSDCDTLAPVIDHASMAFGLLSVSLYNFDHLKALYIHYVSMLTSAFQYYRSLETLTQNPHLKKKLLMQAIIIHDKLGLVRKILHPAQLNEHEKIQRSLARELNQLAPPIKPAATTQTVTEAKELNNEDSSASITDLLESASQHITQKKPDAAKPLLMEIINSPATINPPYLAQAYIMLGHAYIASSYSANGIHAQQTEIKNALKACKKAYTIAKSHHLYNALYSIALFLNDLLAKLYNALQNLQRMQTAYISNMHQPLEQEQPGSLNRLVKRSFDTYADNFRVLMDNTKYMLNLYKYEYTIPDYHLRKAKGVQIPYHRVRSNSMDSFNGVVEVVNKYQVRK